MRIKSPAHWCTQKNEMKDATQNLMLKQDGDVAVPAGKRWDAQLLMDKQGIAREPESFVAVISCLCVDRMFSQ